MIVHDIHADVERLYPPCIYGGTKGSYGIYRMRFSFSSEWNGLMKKVSFYPNRMRSLAVVLTDNEIDIPSEVNQVSGSCKYVVTGLSDDKVIYTVEGSILIDDTLKQAVTPPESPTPTEVQQIYQYMLNAQEYAKSASESAYEAMHASKGEKGDPGPKGEKGDPGTGMTILGTYASVEDLENAVYEPSQGDMYNIGESSPYTVYMWDTTDGTGKWVSQGKLQESYIIGDGLKLDPSTNTLSVDTAKDVEENNTLPVTSAAVYTTVGNINALLSSI